MFIKNKFQMNENKFQILIKKFDINEEQIKILTEILYSGF
jgi:hypothetical protein